MRVSAIAIIGLVLLLTGCPPEPAQPQDEPAEPGSISGRLSVQTDSATAESSEEPVPTTPLQPAFVPGELVVRFEEGLSPAQQDAILAESGMRAIARSPSGFCCVALQSAAKDSAGDKRLQADTLGAKAILRSRKGIRGVETNARRYVATTPSDPYYMYQWHYPAINLPDAWTVTSGSTDVLVAVIDTGILSGHPDLQGQIEGGYCFILDAAAARNGVGLSPDPEDLGDLLGGIGQSSYHGTHVAGTIAAVGENGVGVVGVASGSRVMPLRALGVGGGTSFDVAEAIRYAAGLPNISNKLPPRPAQIINLSVAGIAGEPPTSDESAAIADAINAGVLVVASAGNENSSAPTYPAALPGVIAVGAVDIQFQRAVYSNFGSWITLMAPGGFNGTDVNGDGYGDGVLSTGGTDTGGLVDFEYIFENGTSMAAPHVSGVAALIMAANPVLPAAQVREILQATARDLGAVGRDDQFGYGLVDAAAAVQEALRRGGAAPVETPSLALSTAALDFGSTAESFSVQVSNTGGGFLRVNSVVWTEAAGSGWLSAQLTGTTANSSAAAVVVTVNRATQGPGVYTGTVTVNPEGLVPATINVAMTVGGSPQADEILYILAVTPPPEQRTVAETQTSIAQDHVYTLAAVPPGEYVLYAGTDRDNNGVICEPGDLCGALPSMLEPQVITLGSGQALTDENFGVSQRVVQVGPGLEKAPVTLRRLQ